MKSEEQKNIVYPWTSSCKVSRHKEHLRIYGCISGGDFSEMPGRVLDADSRSVRLRFVVLGLRAKRRRLGP